MLQIPSKIKSETCREAKSQKSWNPHCDQNRLRTSTKSFPLCARWCLQPPCLCIGGVLRWGQHPREHFTLPQDQKKYKSGHVASCHNSWIFSRSLISAGHMTLCQSYFPHISRSLANGGCQQRSHRGGCFAFTSSGPAQKSEGRKTRTLDVQTTAEGVDDGESRKETKQNNKEEMKSFTVRRRNPFLFQIKTFALLDIQADSGDTEVSSQRAVMFYIWTHFLLNADWERWATATRRCPPQEGNLIRRILSRDALQSHLERTNPYEATSALLLGYRGDRPY